MIVLWDFENLWMPILTPVLLRSMKETPWDSRGFRCFKTGRFPRQRLTHERCGDLKGLQENPSKSSGHGLIQLEKMEPHLES